MQSNDTENAPSSMLTVDEASLKTAESELEQAAPSPKHVFENCHKNKEIRDLFRKSGLFCRLFDDKGEQPINTSYENLLKELDTYRSIERFGVENKMALRGVRKADIARAQAFRATYANMVADRIFDAVPYGHIYFHLIMAYYAVSRINFDRLFFYQLGSLLVAMALSGGVVRFLILGDGAPSLGAVPLAALAIAIAALFTGFNSMIHGFYKNAVDLNTTTIADKIRERIFHLITAEQTCFSRITTEENSAGSDAEWRERAGVWAIAAVAYRWRVFLLKQFLDVGAHKTTRHYVWLHKYKILSFLAPIALLTLAWFAATAVGATPDILKAPRPVEFLNHQGAASFIALTLFLVLLPAAFLWSANPARSINQIAARIGTADAGIDVDTPIDMIVHLVGRVSTAKNEGRRN